MLKNWLTIAPLYLSGDRAIPDFSGLGLDYSNDSSVAQMSDMPFDSESIWQFVNRKDHLGNNRSQYGGKCGYQWSAVD